MKLNRLCKQLLLAASLFAVTEAALASITSTVGAGIRGTQQGRISRGGVPQDWAHDEAFGDGAVPAVINTTTTYFYTTFAVNVGSLNYLDIEIDSLSANTFLAVFQTAYLPNSSTTGNLGFDTNWLGDAGTSGDAFGTDPLFTDVVAAMNSTVILVVYNTAAGGVGLTDPFTLSVFAYPDSGYSADPVELAITRVPEPSTLLLLLAPLGLIAVQKLRARRQPMMGAFAA